MCPAVFIDHAEGNTSIFMLEYFLFPQTFPLGLGDGQFYSWTDGLRRKDWHDYESIQKEALRSGTNFRVRPSAAFTSVFRFSQQSSYVSFPSACSKDVCLMGTLGINIGQNQNDLEFHRQGK